MFLPDYENEAIDFHTMSKSPYFATSVARQTRAAAKSATQLLNKNQLKRRKHITVEYENEDNTTSQWNGRKRKTSTAGARGKKDVKNEESSVKREKKERKVDDVTKTKVAWEPANWKEQLANIREMRKDRDAPVDSQGCERTADIKASPQVITGVRSRKRVFGIIGSKSEQWEGDSKIICLLIEVFLLLATKGGGVKICGVICLGNSSCSLACIVITSHCLFVKVLQG